MSELIQQTVQQIKENLRTNPSFRLKLSESIIQEIQNEGLNALFPSLFILNYSSGVYKSFDSFLLSILESLQNKNDVYPFTFKAIIDHIIVPHKNKGYNIPISYIQVFERFILVQKNWETIYHFFLFIQEIPNYSVLFRSTIQIFRKKLIFPFYLINPYKKLLSNVLRLM